LVIKAHAKINLSLFVTGRREDGYHDLRSIFLKVGVFDTIFIKPSFREEIHASAGPEGKDNLVAKVLRNLPYHVYIQKKIPMGAGLGGGSSDAAAIIKYFFKDGSRAFEVALLTGSDVPFFLIEENAAVVRGRGEDIEPFNVIGHLFVVIYYPGLIFSTAEGYRELSRKRLYFNEDEAEERIREIKEILLSGSYTRLRGLLFNSFELIHRGGVIEDFKDFMVRNGAIDALMTGSGSAMFALFDHFPFGLYREYHDRFFFTAPVYSGHFFQYSSSKIP